MSPHVNRRLGQNVRMKASAGWLRGFRACATVTRASAWRALALVAMPARAGVQFRRFCACAITIAASACALLALAATPAMAGVQFAPCDRPFVFSDAAVNVVVLPYSVPPSIRGGSRDAGDQLALLVQRETLLAIAKFGSVGAVHLKGDPENGCTPEIVGAKLLGERSGAAKQIAAGRGLVMVWGRVLQTGDDLFLQTFVRFLRRGVAEQIDTTVGDKPFTARLSAQAFACVPRRITVADFRAVQQQFDRAQVLRPSPDESVAGEPMIDGSNFAYFVTSVKDDWLEVQSMTGGPSRWLLARATAPEWSLRARMPELSFVEGIAGYLRYRVGPGDPAMLDAAKAAIVRYQAEWRTGALLPQAEAKAQSPAVRQSLARAVPLQVLALAGLLDPRDDALVDVLPRIAGAEALVPVNADVRNLELVARLRLASAGRVAFDPNAAVASLQRALGTDPTNDLTFVNLRNLYAVMLAGADARPAWWPAGDADRDQLQREYDALAKLSAGG